MFYATQQSAKVICRFTGLRIAHSKRQTSHMNIENLSTSHTFDYIVFRVKPGATNCEDLAMALSPIPRQEDLGIW